MAAEGLPAPTQELPPISESSHEPAPGSSFSKYLKAPVVDETKIGMTSRVAKIVSAASSEPSAGVPVTDDEREQWKKERMQLKDQVLGVKRELRKYKRYDHDDIDDLDESPKRDYEDVPYEILGFPERGAAAGSELTELALLRRENIALRNMTSEEKHSKAREIMLKLRAEIEALKEENKNLRSQVEGFLRSRDTLADRKPPQDILSTLRRLPLELSEADRDLVERAIEMEWKNDYIRSRHGGGKPITNPFDRRKT
jgi:hypothetical protein